MFSLLLLGFLLGMRHTLEADHLAAVATLTSNAFTTRRAITQGAVWGLGHTLTLFLFGSIVLVFDSVVPQRMATTLEMVVGVMLLCLGLDVLNRLRKQRIHFHQHKHEDVGSHFHAHAHAHESFKDVQTKTRAPESVSDKKHEVTSHQHEHASGFPIRALVVGAIHGMAGSAALIVLTLQTVKSVSTGLLYIALFGFGSVLGMAVLSVIVAVPLRRSAKGLTWLHNGLQFTIGIVTIYFGCTLALDGLSALTAVQPAVQG